MRTRSNQNNQRGSVSVEFGLCIPALLVLLLGGIHLGRVLGARHRLADATGYATRASAIAGVTDATAIKTQILARMAGNKDCTSINVTSSAVGAPPYRGLQVTAKCNLTPPFGAGILGAVGPSDISVTASMPF